MIKMIKNYWNRYLEKNPGAVLKGTICFGDNRDAADEACVAIAQGRKTAHCYPANGYRVSMKGKPASGDLNIVVDWNGKPACIIECTGISELRFDDADAAVAMKETGCGDIQAWREAKEAEFKKELEEIGTAFDGDTMFIMEEFKTIFAEQA